MSDPDTQPEAEELAAEEETQDLDPDLDPDSVTDGASVDDEEYPEAAEVVARVLDSEDGETDTDAEETDDEASIPVISQRAPNYDGSPLAEHISSEHLELLHAKFLSAPKRKISAEAFRAILESMVDLVFEDDDYQLLFLKMQSGRCGYGWLTWNDLISHLTLEYNDKNTATVQVNLDTPIDGPPKNYKTHHRHPITRVLFCPALGPDRQIKYTRGCYASVSHEGLINYWNLDLELVRSVTSKAYFLKVANTWITDMVFLPDFDVLCVSSTERELRFYDTTACQFELRVVVYSLDYAVSAMHYAWSDSAGGDGHLVTGDMGGGVRVYTLAGEKKGPFHHAPGVDVRAVLSEQVVRGELKGMAVKDYKGVHGDWVREVYYDRTLSCVFSCAVSGESALVMRDAQGDSHTYHMAQGAKCFSVQEDAHLIATGGPDCLVRLWNAFVSNKAVCVFRGHHATVIAVVIQGDIQRVVSLSKDRCIKVWDITFQNCIQTYTQLPASLGDDQFMTTFYNPMSHSLIVAGLHFSVLPCGTLVPEQLTDGYTHTREVTCIVYNPLFQVLISMGCRSMIMVWDPWKGQRRMLIKEAHTKIWYGQIVVVEITAATFDPTYHLLLTGARDGTIKMWNFNTGYCIRNMSIEADREVTGLIWLKGRILATGWNRHVEEWEDGVRLTPSKCWEQRHHSDVLAAVANAPQCLATASYAGELVLWRMETGQAFRRHTVGNPTVQTKLEYMPRPAAGQGTAQAVAAANAAANAAHNAAANAAAYAISAAAQAAAAIARQDSSLARRSMQCVTASVSRMNAAQTAAARMRLHRISEAPAVPTMRSVAVHCMLFLHTRIANPAIGSLFVALENGFIQVWSHHSAGGFLTAFQAVHVAGDYVVAMASDPQDNYLFTGTTSGYVKVWLLANYYSADEVPVLLPLLRLQFPFLWHDRIEGRAKRRVRSQPLPMLLTSHRAHLRAVNTIIYNAPARVLFSCSNDSTVRVWTLGGRYIGTLGTPRTWIPFPPETGPGPDYPYRVPPDIKRVGSFTTIRVLNGGVKGFETRKKGTIVGLEKTRLEFPHELLQKCTHGKPLGSPRLGRGFKMPPRNDVQPAIPRIDTSGARIPVFCHLALSPEVPYQRPTTPPGVVERRRKVKPEHSSESRAVTFL